ncbi:MAG TPA: hypothetical protein VEG30_13745 [Terriglobales bacterium]|nr:hypothetical protein [Terriglobales bacterium]
MKAYRLLVVVTLVWFCATAAIAQTKIAIPAGSPEDKALNQIQAENDQQKRIAMLEEFTKTYSGNPQAVAYGNWQLSQQYAGSDPAKALAYGDKALAAMPNVLEILQSQTDIAQQMKDSAKVVDYAARGAAVINGMEKQPKPAGMSDEQFASEVARDKQAVQPVYDYMQAAAYNAVISETDPKKRLALIEKFSSGFSGSKMADQVNALAIASLQEAGDLPGMLAFGDKILAAEPNNVQVLTLMANAFAEEPKGTYLSKADSYARRAIEAAKKNASTTDASLRITEGLAHEVLGYTLLRQEKTPAAIAELKTAASMLKDDPAKYSITLYRLGFAYAKSNRIADAKETLAEAVKVQGPFQQASKELLDKVNARPVAKKAN